MRFPVRASSQQASTALMPWQCGKNRKPAHPCLTTAVCDTVIHILCSCRGCCDSLAELVEKGNARGLRHGCRHPRMSVEELRQQGRATSSSTPDEEQLGSGWRHCLGYLEQGFVGHLQFILPVTPSLMHLAIRCTQA